MKLSYTINGDKEAPLPRTRLSGGKVFFVMYGKVISACLHGVDGKLVEVEVDLSNGLPVMNIVGLPDSAIKESMERVRAAVKNCGFTFPLQRITVNLAPADVRKEGASFDLAIALGLLITSGQLPEEDWKDTMVLGELALDGSIRPVPGVLSMLATGLDFGVKRVLVPAPNAEEAGFVEGMEIRAISHLAELKGGITGNSINVVNNSPHLSSSFANPLSDSGSVEDYADVCGQLHVKRALMICAAGMHNLLILCIIVQLWRRQKIVSVVSRLYYYRPVSIFDNSSKTPSSNVNTASRRDELRLSFFVTNSTILSVTTNRVINFKISSRE